jgi:hypothetical protein
MRRKGLQPNKQKRGGRVAHLVVRPTLTREGVRSQVLAELAFERVKEAQHLLRGGYYTGAAYIVGYGVELLLKAIIAGRQYAGSWPVANVTTEVFTHNLDKLLQIADLDKQMREDSKMNKSLGINWITIRTWGTHLRYIRLPRHEASDMVDAVAEQPDGVAAWLGLRVR